MVSRLKTRKIRITYNNLFHKHITYTTTITANITHLKQFNSDAQNAQVQQIIQKDYKTISKLC